VRTAYSPVSRLVEVHPARKSLRSALGRRTEASSWRAESVRPQQLSTLQRGSRGMGLTPLPGRKQFLMGEECQFQKCSQLAVKAPCTAGLISRAGVRALQTCGAAVV
jgi:hypothetical protein